MSDRVEFDVESLEAIEPGGTEKIVWDEGLPGFGLRVLPSGTRSWIVSWREKGQEGKVRRRRATIGRLGDMSIDAARDRARVLLGGGEAVAEEQPAADRVVAETIEEAEGQLAGAVSAGEAAGAEAWIDPDEESRSVEDGTTERFDPETGEILPAGAEVDDGSWVGEGLSLPELGRPALAGDEGAVTDEPVGPDGEVVEEVLGGVLVGLDDGDGRGERAADDPGVVSAERAVVSEEEEETEGPSVVGSVQEEFLPEEARADEAVAAEKAAAVSLIRRAGGVVGKVGAWVMSRGRKGRKKGKRVVTPRRQQKFREEAVVSVERDASGNGGGDDAAPPAPARLVKRQGKTGGTEEGLLEDKELSDETVSGLAKNLDDVRGQLDRFEESGERLMPQLEEVSRALTVFSKDFRSWRRRRAWPVVALLIVVPVLVGAGMGLQSRVALLPQHDPSLGWSGHIWEHYGAKFMHCYERAGKTASGRARCEFEVRAR